MTPGATHPRGAAVRRPLEALNFFMADIQAGVGPFLGVFLLAHDWQSGWIGTVMTIGGIAGMIMTTPAGALIDATTRKRLYVVVPGLSTASHCSCSQHRCSCSISAMRRCCRSTGSPSSRCRAATERPSSR
jgi:MFS family permease